MNNASQLNGLQMTVNENGPLVMWTDRLISIHFESILDLISWDERGRNADRFREYTNRRSSPGYSNKDWLGSTNRNVGDVIDHALLGDSELLKSLDEKVRSLESTKPTDYVSKIKKVKRKLVHGAYGDEIDIHKVYSGNVDKAFSRRERVEQDQSHRLVTLFINIGGMSVVKCTDSLWRAVVALKVYKDLQAAGKSVRVLVGASAIDSFARDNRLCSFSMVVKNYNESLSLERLAAMSHVGFHRVFGFAARCSQDVRTVSYGLGRTCDTTDTNVPLNVQKEILAGHTKLIFVDKCTSSYDAERNIKSINQQFAAQAA